MQEKLPVAGTADMKSYGKRCRKIRRYRCITDTNNFQESVFPCYIKMKKCVLNCSYTERTTYIENKEK